MRAPAALAALMVAAPAAAAPQLAAGYGEHMVLQRGQPIPIAGEAAPRARVTGRLGGASASATADVEGRFTLTFPARPASETGETLTLTDATGSASWQDILIGDVWLCSGQSNMELSVGRALNTWNELRMSTDDGIRLAMVRTATAPVPREAFARPLTWAAAAPATVEPFSAACYFMAKQLRADRKDVPLGLIHSNWGGSAARAWLDPASVKALHGQAALDQLKLYERDPMAAAQAFAPQWYDWWRANDSGREPWTNPDSLSWKPVPRISFWN
ncbi:MAG: sialate O-acetylesterase, partial [Qipengyuania sp.]|nr:sialate O-acetylesterase [Qipengyuania sp.]